jgi:hypothetical protein
MAMNDPARAAAALQVSEGERRDGGPCPCCGEPTELVWGYVNDETTGPLCVYYVQWTPGPAAHDAHFDLIVGPWGEGTRAADRYGVSLVYRREAASLTVVDAAARSFAQHQRLFGRALAREALLGTPLAATVYQLLDAIWQGDARLGALTAVSRGS